MPKNHAGKRFKAPPLSVATRKSIYQYHKARPDIKISEIAELYRCTYAQANKAAKYGNIPPKINSRNRNANVTINSILDRIECDPNYASKLLQNQINYAFAQLEFEQDKLPVSERVKLIGELRKMMLMQHLRGVDMDVILAIFRHYEPDKKEQDYIMKLEEIKEEVKWQVQKS